MRDVSLFPTGTRRAWAAESATAMTFGQRLEQFRATKGMTQAQMASALEISLRTYTRYANGEGAPNVAHLERLAQLGADVSWLLAGGEHVSPPSSNSGSAHAQIDQELMGRVTDAISRLYKEERVSLAPIDLGRLAAQRYSEIVAATDDPGERITLIKLAVQQLRQELHAKAAAPGTGTGKRSA